jgi:hypothetical protein
VAGAVPGLQVTGSLVVDMLFRGAANAYMTLRIGLMTREYCGALAVESPAVLRRKAVSEAKPLLQALVMELATSLVNKVRGEARQSVGKTLVGVGAAVRNTSAALIESLRTGPRE